MNYLKFISCILLLGFIADINKVYGQEPERTSQDTLTLVEILPGVRKLELRRIDSLTELQILAGNVQLRQGSVIFTCDSCVINNRLKTFEAFGHVHINDSDTANIYSDYLKYLTDKKIAYFKKRVRLTDGHGTLLTEELEYDINTKIGIYTNGGKVLNKQTVLTSTKGEYYADVKDVYFSHNVELKDPAFYVKTDSLLYNTQTETARFITDTYILDSSGRTIETRQGYYNLRSGKAEFHERPVIRDDNLFVTGQQIASDDSAGIVQIRGNAVVIDSLNNTTVLAGEIFVNKKTNAFLAVTKPLMIIKQEEDSIYITADTLFSARLTDLHRTTDSSYLSDSTSLTDSIVVSDSTAIFTNTATRISPDTLNEKDSTNRYFEAFRHVRVFSDSLQAVSDSLFYSFRDSVFRLYQDPVVWSNKNQITGDTILLFTKNKKAQKIEVFEKSFLVAELDSGVYNQVKATRMDGYFVDGSIDSVRARGTAKSIYYIQDEDSAYTGINEAESDILDIYFRNKELQKVVFRSAVKGTIWPMSQKSPSEMRLENFRWLETRRPKTKFELFE